MKIFKDGKKKVKGFFGEFKEFISRGNIVDLSVAVVVGGAFSAIVTALTNKIIMPLINWILALCGGDKGLESAYTILSPVVGTDGKIDLTKSIYIDWGAFISSILNFLIIAFVIFSLIKVLNASKKQFVKLENDVKKQASLELIQEKKEIKRQAKEQNVPFKKLWKEHLDKKQEELNKKIEEEKRAKEEEEKKKAEVKTTEQLLQEIVVLLKEKELASTTLAKEETSTKEQMPATIDKKEE